MNAHDEAVISELKKQQSELGRKIKAAEKKKKISALIEKWQKVQAYLGEIESLKDKYNLTDATISRAPMFYKYRDGKRRTNDKHEDWIQDYISKGGSISALEQNATQFLEREALKQLKTKRGKKASTKKSTDKTSAPAASKGDAKRTDTGVGKKGIRSTI
jgi:hypothetical protein